MEEAVVLSVRDRSAAARAGISPGDVLVAIDGVELRDVIEYRWLADRADPTLTLRRDGRLVEVVVTKDEGEPLGIDLACPIFDQVTTCDNACDFCFIHQLPRGLRRSLYVKDDDYRLSFLYGNYTTLTRFTERDLERVVRERLGPLNVSIHTTNPELRARMLRNPKGATSLRWLEEILDAGIEVHGQIVVCPGVNDGVVLEETFCDLLDRFPSLASCCVVPVGVSKHNRAPSIRPHTREESLAVLESVHRWQEIFLEHVGRRILHAADEYYLRTGVDFPPADHYEGFPMYEDGVGVTRLFELEFLGGESVAEVRHGFFAWVDGAPPFGYRAVRTPEDDVVAGVAAPGRPVVLTGELGAAALRRILPGLGVDDLRVEPVANRFFGGNVAVTGLLAGEDVVDSLLQLPADARPLIPDVCLSDGVFIDGVRVDELPRPVEILPTDGAALRRVLEG
ncbi:MAG: hypothetical protein KatS3mg008_0316 [Acidimicrobiales bacterium]|nr:MAG: hypothetical protein KatS3mg008_0316 [Acidimicrobiales bacterium]